MHTQPRHSLCAYRATCSSTHCVDLCTAAFAAAGAAAAPPLLPLSPLLPPLLLLLLLLPHVHSYGPGLKKQRACVACPGGLSSFGKSKQTTAQACSKSHSSCCPAHSAASINQVSQKSLHEFLPRASTPLQPPNLPKDGISMYAHILESSVPCMDARRLTRLACMSAIASSLSPRADACTCAMLIILFLQS